MAMAPEAALPLNGASEPPPAARAARLRRWAVRLALGGAVLGYLVWKTEWRPLVELFRQAEPWGWCLALVLYAGVQMGLSSSRWRVLAEPLGFRAPWLQFFKLYYVGLFFNLFLPTSMGGDVVRAWTLAGAKERRAQAFWSVISDRLSGLVALAVLACLATLLYDRPLPLWIPLTVWGLAGGLVGGYALLPWLGRFSPRLKAAAESLSVSRAHWRGWLLALGISVAVQSASVVQIALMGRSLGLDVPLLGYAVVVPLVSLLCMLPLSVGGMGVREGSLILLLAPFGVKEAGALALGLSWFAMNLVMGLAGGLVCLFRRARAAGGAAADSAQGLRPGGRPAAAPPLREERTHGTVDRRAAEGRARERAAAA